MVKRWRSWLFGALVLTFAATGTLVVAQEDVDRGRRNRKVIKVSDIEQDKVNRNAHDSVLLENTAEDQEFWKRELGAFGGSMSMPSRHLRRTASDIKREISKQEKNFEEEWFLKEDILDLPSEWLRKLEIESMSYRRELGAFGSMSMLVRE